MANEDVQAVDMTSRRDTVCVIGAGPAGLASARALRARGIPVEILETNSRVGGVWDIDAPGSPMYEAAHFVSSKTVSGFWGFPMPDDFPDYPSYRQVFSYLQAFADEHGLQEIVRFRTTVTRIEPHEGAWLVSTDDGRAAMYRAVICCSGAQWTPRIAELPGDFDGRVIHSSEYRDLDSLRGERVLVVGGGNSACDIAVDVARVASSVTISMRRGYWFIPKHIFGIPSDVFAAKGPHLPKRVEQRVFSGLLRALYGRPERIGLQAPDHRIFETHPVLNSNLFLALQHGDVRARPGITDIDGRVVSFRDGSKEAVDTIVLATGYEHSAPYADAFLGAGRFADMYLTIASRTHPGLFGLSFTETNSGAYAHFDEEAQLIASFLDDQHKRPEKARAFAALIRSDRPDLSGGISFDPSARHAGYVDAHALTKYRRKLFRSMGWQMLDRPRSGSTDRVRAYEARLVR